MDAPLVSIVVRSTARPTLAAALASVGAQTHPAVEAVVVAASGSSHPTPPPATGAHPVRFVASAVPLSRPQAANAGVDAARGEWITFLDDDDAIDPTHVAGLVAAARGGRYPAVASLARVRMADGSVRNWGQPFALTELYVRNFLHLSTVLFARSLVDAGCRFDEAFDIMQDWDYFLQIAQHGPFHSTGLRSFEWHADVGSSGAGGGANEDPARFARYRDLIYAKWSGARATLIARIEPLLQQAGAALAAGDDARAEAAAEAVLAVARNEPNALAMLAAVEDRRGRRDDAVALMSLAATVCPHEARFLVGLARLVLARGERQRAARLAEHALALSPGDAAAAQLLASLRVP
ncbi:MAG TPA: glycosyltransferase [Casimicrobiaceae bacterium]|nr:glycosyltransferase [Casimicrobiaceae bacterium]